MPKAVSDKLSRSRAQVGPVAATKRMGSSGSSSSAPSTKNPIFNTDRFGQHILKNPLVAQR